MPLHLPHGAVNNLGSGITALLASAELERGSYRNRFVAVPAGTPVAPLPQDRPTVHGPQAGFIRVRQIRLLEKIATEADGTRWWEIDVGTGDGAPRTGWAREKGQANVRLCSPWGWPGFEIVKGETSTPAQLYARHIVQQG
ncbi:hypothetical protein H0E84_14990 [Luteimonas sp. SJ-92]|uniref:Uncharacterized protein n=1 Tax=Luteimonas salinisoli TaxID=2752307 RepID=A0A853JFQ8_9GAMM|nr:hypothetical protein [Luteimonas salinisoli]NZA27685.1 hypothetical protein [Luteimonas salinisoli]